MTEAVPASLHRLNVLTQLVLLPWVRPPKQSECSNCFQLLQLDLQGSSLASKCLWSARALTLVPASQFPWKALPKSKPVALNLHKADVPLMVAAQLSGACGWLYDNAHAPWNLSYTCKLRCLVMDPPNLLFQQLETAKTWPQHVYARNACQCKTLRAETQL